MNKKHVPGLVVAAVAVGVAAVVATHTMSDDANINGTKTAATSSQVATTKAKSQDQTATSTPSSNDTSDTAVASTSDNSNQVPADQKSSTVLAIVTKPADTTPAAATTTSSDNSSNSNGSTGTGSTGTTSTGTGSTGTTTTGTGTTGTGSTGTTPADPTSPTNPTNPVVTPGNLLVNPSVETATAGQPDNFQNYADPADQFAFSYQTTGGEDGNAFLRTEMTGANTNRYGATTYGSWSPDAVTVNTTTPEMYKFSVWYKSDVDTEIDAEITLADGTQLHPVLGRPLASATWKQFTASFEVPANTVSVTAYQIILTHGTLDTDNYYLGNFVPTAINGGGMVSLTFDDGWKSAHDNGWTYLQTLGLTSTDYLISSVISSNATDYPSYVTTSDVQDYINSGVEIGDHTIRHIPLTDKASLAAAGTTEDNEITGGKSALQALFPGVAINSFASPEGEYDSQTVSILQQDGLSHRSVEEGYNSPDAGVFNPYDIKVQDITAATTPAQVQGWIDEAKATGTWLVIVYHEIANAPAEDVGTYTLDEQYWTKISDFQAEADAVKASGLQVVTMSQGLAKINAQLGN